MSFADSVTPPNTTEIKPGLFVQKKGNRWRKVEPIAWNGKLRINAQLKSLLTIKTLVWFGVLILLVMAYNNDNAQLIEFHNQVVENPVMFCNELIASYQSDVCTEQWEKFGLCNRRENIGIDFSTIKLLNATQNTNSIS